jgi:methionine-rich copper-binding protein CopC
MTNASRIAVAWLLAAAYLSLPRVAHAHAFLDHASPRVGSSVRSPTDVTLTFTEGVEPACSKIEVLDADAKPIGVGALEHPDATTLRVSLPRLPAGKYKVKWKVVSVDTHDTEGTFQFSVEAP